MIPIKGVYLLLIMAGSPDTPERIGLEQQLSTEACQQKAQEATAQKKYAFVRCVDGGAIVSDSLGDQDQQIVSDPPPLEHQPGPPPLQDFPLGGFFGQR